MPAIDPITESIKTAAAAGVREALSVHPATNRRLLTIEEAATYLGRSKREMFNMIASEVIPTVGDGKLRRFDIQDLDAWIANNKK